MACHPDFRSLVDVSGKGDDTLRQTLAPAVSGDLAEFVLLPRIVIIGCSGHARVAIDIIEEQGRYSLVGLIDSYKPIGTELLGYQVLGREEDLAALLAAGICEAALVAIGDNWVRAEVIERIRKLAPQLHFVSAVHPSASIARDVVIGCGTVIMAGVVVNTGSRIGEFCILNTSSSLDHDCVMGPYSSLAPRAVTGGSVRIGAYSVIAIGATVSHEITIGEHVVVGAGATVVKDVPDHVVVYGTPAQVIRERAAGDPYLISRSAKSRAVRTQTRTDSGTRISPALNLVAVTSHEWRAYLDCAPHDFFHTAGYHQVDEWYAGGTAWMAVYGRPDRFVAWPYVLREIPNIDGNTPTELFDVSSVYGYAGPIVSGPSVDQDFFQTAWSAILDAWKSQGVVSVFTRYHPLLANQKWLEHCVGAGASADEDQNVPGRTVAIDLSQTQEQIWNAYDRHLKQGIRRCLSAGMVPTADPEWDTLESLIRLYYQTMKRNNASVFYYFPSEYFRRLKQALGPQGTLVAINREGEIAAIGLLLECRGIATLHLLASDDRFAHFAPAKYLIHYAQQWAQARGNRWLHLGGGRAGRHDDSLFRFKSMFSDATFAFCTGRWILRREIYDSLTTERRAQAMALNKGALAKDYFPSYRAPFLRSFGTARSNSEAHEALLTGHS